MSSNTCSLCNEEVTKPILCVVCNKPFHDTCGLFLVKSSSDVECNLCTCCSQLPEVRKSFSFPPQQRQVTLHRSDSDSSLTLKRKKGDLVALHKNFLTETLTQYKNSVNSNTNALDTSEMITEDISLNNTSSLTVTTEIVSATASSLNKNTFVYNPKPLLMVNDPKNATLEEITDVFNKNFNLIREDFNNISNFCKVQQQFSTNCYNTINAYSNILKSHEEQIGNLNSKIRTMEIDYSSNLMISGLENIENSNVDLKSMIATLANYLKVNLSKQDIRKVRIVKTPSNTSLVQVTFYSSAHCLRLLDNKKSRGNITNSDVFNYSMSANPIYINELLPQDTHKLLTATRNLKRSFGLFRVWHNKGQIFLQISPDDRAILINGYKDLDDLSKNLSSDLALQQQQLQNIQPQNNLQQQTKLQAHQLQQQQPQNQQLQIQQQQQLSQIAQPQTPHLQNYQFRSQFNSRQPQVRSHLSRTSNQLNQRKQDTFHSHLHSQPSTSTHIHQKLNSSHINNPNYPHNSYPQNRHSKNNNQSNYINKNYTSFHNVQQNPLNYRPSFPNVPQSFSLHSNSFPTTILRQPVLQQNPPKNPTPIVPLLSPPPLLSSQPEEPIFSQDFSQQSQK